MTRMPHILMIKGISGDFNGGRALCRFCVQLDAVYSRPRGVSQVQDCFTARSLEVFSVSRCFFPDSEMQHPVIDDGMACIHCDRPGGAVSPQTISIRWCRKGTFFNAFGNRVKKQKMRFQK